MRKPEQSLWDSMNVARKGISESPNEFWFQRLENSVATGMPDVRAIRKRNGLEFWVELKQGPIPKKPETPVFRVAESGKTKGMRVSQINWHIKQHSMRGISFILAKLNEELYLFHGQDADRINEKTIAQLKRIQISVHGWADIFNYWRHL